MEERFHQSPAETSRMNTEELRKAFAITDIMEEGKINFVYSHYDRMIIGGAMPSSAEIVLQNYEPLKADYFLERREMGIINIGGEGMVKAEGKEYFVGKLDCLYLGMGTEDISFKSNDDKETASFYILSCGAHHAYENKLMKKAEAVTESLGSSATSNERTIYKHIHQNGIKSCQLVMGLTILKEGNVWNTMPAHTHNRRMEVYLYFDLKEGQRVFHFMGQPTQTRHLVLGNQQAVISAPWCIHAGCGTSSYSFIWGMAGENQSFADMDFVEIKNLL
ncbi:MAG: 5-dehydro-4-deoxy-D-glucuronate isomerase [Bacteroidota bacterium]|nr:5-dehydro-4-deoxy-D-glucuronate isomerase [Bacteroidota bacterium]